MEAPALRIDVSGTTCPMTFVRLKVALEGLSPGEVLEAVLSPEGHPDEIPPSVREEGHEVLSLKPSGNRVVIRIRKGKETGGPDG